MPAALGRLVGLPGVGEAVDEAREACTRLRWHPALRRRSEEARAEAGVRAVRASAALAGARLPVSLVRDAARGAAALPDDPVGRTVRGALRAHAEAEALPAGWERAPLQVLARLHTVAAAGLVPDAALGRPRVAGEVPGDGADLLIPGPTPGGEPLGVVTAEQLPARLRGLAALLAAPPEVPALVVAALVHAELATLRPFVTANGVVARATCRSLVVGRGLDPTGVTVWEGALLAAGPPYPLALARYALGDTDAVRAWLVFFARAVIDGAGEGTAVADAVAAGRLPRE